MWIWADRYQISLKTLTPFPAERLRLTNITTGKELLFYLCVLSIVKYFNCMFVVLTKAKTKFKN